MELKDLEGKVIESFTAVTHGDVHRVLNLQVEGGCVIVSFYEKNPCARIIDATRRENSEIFETEIFEPK